MVRFQIMVDEETYQALRSLSKKEYRDWRLQAGFLIREALQGCGYLAEQPKYRAEESHGKRGINDSEQ